MDSSTKNVFGQPRLRASLRDLRSPRKNYKSTIEDDLKKLIIMDNLAPEQEREAGVRGGCPCHAHTHARMRAVGQAEGAGPGQGSSWHPLQPLPARGTHWPVGVVCAPAARSQDIELVRDRITV